MALLPFWEGTLQRLAEPHTPAAQRPSSPGDGSRQRDAPAGAAQQAAAAVQLLCAACGSQPQAVLRQHPALLAEVCRQSFRFTCAYAPLLAAQQRAAADDTRTAAEAARRQLAHATKYRDHVADYLLAKCSCPSGSM
jgi:ribosomal protein S14